MSSSGVDYNYYTFFILDQADPSWSVALPTGVGRRGVPLPYKTLH